MSIKPVLIRDPEVLSLIEVETRNDPDLSTAKVTGRLIREGVQARRDKAAAGRRTVKAGK